MKKFIVILTLLFASYYQAQDSTYLTPIIPDFQVNFERGVNQFNHSISNVINGNYVITWVEGSCIYAQRYSINNGAIEGNFKVNDNFVEHIWPQPSISMNDIGNFMITWPSDSNVFAQHYSNNGSPIGQNFLVNNNANNGWDPLISSDGEGNFIIFWIHIKGGFYKSDFFAKWFSSEGSAIGNNFKIDIDENAENPSFSVDRNGNIIVTWTNRPGNDSLYLKGSQRMAQQ